MRIIRFRYRLKSLLVSGIVCAGFAGQVANAQVTVNINSGNPAFPFPQFLPYYNNLGNLGTQNAPGVTHAEMEQVTRDAWQIFANEFVYSGVTVNGVKYIKGNTGCPYDCTEGEGYSMLGAAYMADKNIFDGLWMRSHDLYMVGYPRYQDGVVSQLGYAFGINTLVDVGSGTASATDGSIDIALAMLMAWQQWGSNAGIVDYKGNTITYKQEALRVIKGLVERQNAGYGNCQSTSGSIGFDGYVENGNTGPGETTPWAVNQYSPYCPKNSGPNTMRMDYCAPAYFHQFAQLLQNQNDSTWNINQFLRGEASSDWLMGKMLTDNAATVPLCGNVSLNGTTTTYSNYSDGEDFRNPWRTILNYVWHGNPTTSWDPVAHQTAPSSNTDEYKIALRLAKFLKDPTSSPWGNACQKFGGGPDLTYKGEATLKYYYTPQGKEGTSFTLNWLQGGGSPAAVAAQDFDLMGKMFRQCVIEWDVKTAGDGYLTSIPGYFHGWFRMLGMLVLSGNTQPPLSMVAKPNLKVYHKMDKTYGFTNDKFTYTVSYRNYGSVNSAGTVVKLGIPKGFTVVSITKGGTLVDDSVVWNTGIVKGFQTGALAQTMDSVQVVVQAGPALDGRYCTTASITCSKGFGAVSNEYPNTQTAVMQRNCVDIVKRALKISKSSDRTQYNSGQTATYKINFENSSSAGWITGGRPGVDVSFAEAYSGAANAANQNTLKVRLFHDAAEAYIDYGNYRLSYFMNDPSITCYAGPTGCPVGWGLMNTILEGGDAKKVVLFQENIVPGSDSYGAWNQRFVIQFAPQLATTTQHLSNYYGLGGRIHQGGTAPLRAVWILNTPGYANRDWTKDWSYDANASDVDGGLYSPVGDDNTDIYNPNIPVTTWHQSACTTASHIVKNVLVEEWDGYTWRKILGNGPIPGRDVQNVTITDTLPAGITFKGFIRQNPLGINATTSTITGGRTVITWTIPKIQVNQKDSIVYTATINTITCPGADQTIVNKAWIQGATESAINDPDSITVTCAPITVCPTATTMTKTSDKTSYTVGQNVQYSIGYTQTIGSIASPTLSTSAADWTAQNGNKSNATFGTNGITVGQINTGDLVLTHDYSYGTNTLGNGIEGTILLTGFTNTAIVVRHGGGSYANGVFIVIDPDNPQILVSVYNGTTLVGTGTSPFLNPTTLDFRVKLTGNKLDLWLNPSAANFGSLPNVSVTGITIQAGFAGIARGNIMGKNSGTSILAAWTTHLDAAFNVTITDPIPTGITTPSTISSTGTNNAGTITWNLVTGKTPMLYNANQTLTWNGIFSSCAKITNIAYANTMGIPVNQYGVCYGITCGTIASCIPPTTVTVSSVPAACVGDVVTLKKGTVTLGSGTNYRYVWYKQGTTPTNYSPNYSDLILPALAISDNNAVWVLRVEDGSTGVATCYKEASVTLTLNPIPNVSAGKDTMVCVGGTIRLNGSSTSPNPVYAWSKAGGTFTSSNAKTLIPNILLSDSGTYYLKVTSLACSNNDTVRVRVNATPGKLTVKSPIEICQNAAAPLLRDSVSGITGTFIVYDGSTLIANPDAFRPDASTIIINRAYSVSQKSAGCESSKATITVDVNPLPAPQISGDGFACGGTTKTYGIVSAPTFSNFKWTYTNGASEVTSNANKSQVSVQFGNSAAILQVRETTQKGCSNSNLATLNVSVDAKPAVASAGADTQPCPSETIKLSGNNPAPGTGKWVKLPASTGGTIDSPSLANSTVSGLASGQTLVARWTIKSTNGYCDTTFSDVRLVASTSSAASVSLTSNPSRVCVGDSVTLSTVSNNQGASPKYSFYNSATNDTIGRSTDGTLTIPKLTSTTKIKVALRSNSSCLIDPSKPTVNSNEIEITVDTVPQTPNAGASKSICAANFNLEATKPAFGKLKWTSNQLGVTFVNDTLYNTTAQNLPAGVPTIFMITVSNGACAATKSDTVSITRTGNLTVSKVKSQDTTICGNDRPPVLLGMSLKPGETGTWKAKSPSPASVSQTNANATITGLAIGRNVFLYEITSTACAAASSVDSVTVTRMPEPAAKITNALPSYCAGGAGATLQANNLGTNAVYQWFRGNTGVGTGISLPNATAGTYALKASAGACSATSDSVTVTQKPLLTAAIDTANLTYCQGAQGATLSASPAGAGTTYLWIKDNLPLGTAGTNNQLLSATAGLYAVAVTLDGCTDTSATAVVREVGSISANIRITADDTAVCVGGTATVRITSQSAGTVEWFVNNVSKGNTSPLVFQPTGNTTVRAEITTTASCANPKTAKDSLEIKVTQATTATITVKLDKITGLGCEGDSAYLSATTNVGSVSWSNGATGNKAVFAGWKNGDTATATLTNLLACVTPKVAVAFQPLNGTARVPFDFALSILPNAGSVICKNMAFKLYAKTGVPKLAYTWFVGNQVVGIDSFLPVPATSDIAGYVAASIAGCYASGNSVYHTADFAFTLAQPVTVSLDPSSKASICGDAAFLNTIATGSISAYRWYLNNTLQAGLTLGSAKIGGLRDGDSLRVEAVPATSCPGIGTASDRFAVAIDKQPQHGFTYGGGTLFFCAGRDTSLASVETNPAYHYQWLKGAAEVQDGNANSLQVAAAGAYTLVTTNGTCSDTSKATAQDSHLSLTVSADPAAEFEVGDQVRLTANVDNPQGRPLSFAWSPSALFSPANGAQTLTSPTGTMLAKVYVVTREGCTASDSILLKKKDKLFIPNALTPETGDQNAVWGITGAENYPDLDIKVFNRWGTLVHEQRGYTQPWDGTLGGKQLPAGTYYYVLKHRTLEKPKVGDLTIVR